MAIDVTTRYRGTLAGQGSAAGGHTSTGSSANNKVVAIGDINITTYTAGGEPVTAADFGLESIDCILLEVVTVDTAEPATAVIHVVNYDYVAGQVLCWDGAAGTTVAGSTARVRFAAFGDVAVPELT
jgi:hypothetical protein